MFYKKLLPALIIVFGFLFLTSGKVSASELYLSPRSLNIPAGSTVAVQVRLNTEGEQINGVTAALAYPADKLQVVYVNYAASKFEIKAEETYQSGLIKISRGTLSPVSGDVNVATIGFEGKGTGAAIAYFTGGSLAARVSNSSDSLNLSKSTGANIQVVTSLPKASSAPNSLMITDIKVDSIATNSATIHWNTSLPADSYVEYGLDNGSYILNTSIPTLATDHTVTLSDPLLVPGAIYHFRVASKDQSGNQVASDDQTFQLKGYDIKIHVTDLNSHPVAGAQVYLYSTQSSTKPITDANGDVSFQNMIPGKYLAIVTKNGVQKTGEIDIVENSSLHTFNLKLDFPSGILALPKLGNLPIIIGAGVIALILLIIIIKLIRRGGGGSGSGGINSGASIFSPLEQEPKPDVYKDSTKSSNFGSSGDI